jgi:hypothetical protein
MNAKIIGANAAQVLVKYKKLISVLQGLSFVSIIVTYFIVLGIFISLGDEKNSTYDYFTHNLVLFWTYLVFPIHSVILAPLTIMITTSLLGAISQIEIANNMTTTPSRQGTFAHVKKRLQLFRLNNGILVIIYEWIFSGVGISMVYSLHSPALPIIGGILMFTTPFIIFSLCHDLLAKSTEFISSNNNNSQVVGNSSPKTSSKLQQHQINKQQKQGEQIVPVSGGGTITGSVEG